MAYQDELIQQRLSGDTQGTVIKRDIDVDETGRTAVTGPCRLYSLAVYNNNAAAVYLKLYDVARAPTATDTPVMTIGIQTKTSPQMSFPGGVNFLLGLGMRCTTGVADSDTGAPGSNDCVLNLEVKTAF